MKEFPQDFAWGAATASYQIEGAVSEDGRSPSIWDTFSHTPGKISDRTTGDEACDHYHLMPHDLDLMEALNLNAYRFSISWSRVMPQGTGARNDQGLDFYDRLVDGLLERNITPYITLFHWDLPQILQDKGGFTNRDISDWFADYVDVVAAKLGDRATHWITLNEPFVVYALGYYIGEHAPGIRNLGKAMRVVHNLLRAHGAGVQRIRAALPDAEVGLTNALTPVYADRDKDLRAKERAEAFTCRMFMDPVFKGHYPSGSEKLVMRYNRDAVPEDFNLMSQKIDFIGVNNYSRMLVRRTLLPVPGFREVKPAYPGVVYTEMGWEVFPQGIEDLLDWIREEYDNPTVYITENGAAFPDRVVSENGERRVHDAERTDFLKRYLSAVHNSMQKGSKVKGYFTWTLMDNFEWAHGYTKRFGLYYTDYQTQERILKDSGRWFADTAESNGFTE